MRLEDADDAVRLAVAPLQHVDAVDDVARVESGSVMRTMSW